MKTFTGSRSHARVPAPRSLAIALLAIVTLGFSSTTRGQADGDFGRPANWPAPPFWSPSAPRERTFAEAESKGLEPLEAQAPPAPLPFVAIAPCRQYNSRNSSPLLNGTPRTVPVAGSPCGIPASAAAVSGNITVFSITGATGNGVLKVGTSSPPTSAWINYPSTETQRANAGILATDGAGNIVVQVNQGGGSVDFTLDVNGYYAGGVVTDVTAGTGLTGGGTGSVDLGIASGGVTATELASNAVTSSKIAANAVTSGAIASGAVGNGQLADAAVTDAKVSGPIAYSKLGGLTSGLITFGDASGHLSQQPELVWDSATSKLLTQQLELFGTMKMPMTAASSGTPTAGVLFLGSDRFLHNYGSGSTFIGQQAGNFTFTGDFNTGIGYQALLSNAAGIRNTATGYQSLKSNTDGYGNTATGAFSLQGNTTGHENTAMGRAALNSNTTASRNTALGRAALYSQAYDNSGTPWDSDNTAVGFYSLFSDAPTSTSNGHHNTAVGFYSLQSNMTGFDNTAVGHSAGARVGAGTGYGGSPITFVANTIGNYNTFVGHGTGATANNISNCTAVGIDAYCDAGDQVRLGNFFVTSIGGKVGWTALSDVRAKKEIQELGLGLDFVLKLRPVEYKLKAGNEKTDLGFLAQDIEALLGDRYNVLTVGGDPDRTLSLRYTDLIAPLVKAVQEQQALLDAKSNRITELEKALDRLSRRLSAVEAKNMAE